MGGEVTLSFNDKCQTEMNYGFEDEESGLEFGERFAWERIQ